jgi:hypothetical protein
MSFALISITSGACASSVACKIGGRACGFSSIVWMCSVSVSGLTFTKFYALLYASFSSSSVGKL